MVILGCSVDSVAANAAFAAKYNLPFQLLCDIDREIALAYGAADAPDASANRMTYLIQPDGKIGAVWPPKVDTSKHPAEVLAALG